jgi:hypothetical protein
MLTLLPFDPIGEAPAQGHFWHEMIEGFKYVLGNKVLTIMGEVFMVAGLAVGVIQPLGIFIVTERLGLPKESLQWLLAVNGAAMLVGGGVVAGWANRIAPQKLLMGGSLISAIAVLGVGFSKIWLLTLAFSGPERFGTAFGFRRPQYPDPAQHRAGICGKGQWSFKSTVYRGYGGYYKHFRLA